MQTMAPSLQMWMVIVFLCVGCLLQIISFSVPYWNEFAKDNMGLWQRCSDLGCVAVGGDDLADTMEIGRALQALGLVCYLAILVLVVLYICCKSDLHLLTAAVLLAFLCLFAILIGAVMWASASNTTISWAYYLCFISGLSASAAGGILISVRRQEFLAGISKHVIETQHI